MVGWSAPLFITSMFEQLVTATGIRATKKTTPATGERLAVL